MFSDLTFTVTDAPSRVQSHSSSSTLTISYYTTIKGIFAAATARMQVLVVATTSDIDTATIEIPKSQVTMLSNKGDALIDQCRNSYLMNALILSGLKSFFMTFPSLQSMGILTHLTSYSHTCRHPTPSKRYPPRMKSMGISTLLTLSMPSHSVPMKRSTQEHFWPRP